MSSDKPKTIPRWLNYVIGGISGSTAIAIVQPADLLKTRMQLMGIEGQKSTVIKVFKSVLKKEGVFGFYNGLSAAVFRQLTYGTGRLGSFYGLMDWHQDRYGVAPNFPTKLLMGSMAGAVGAFVGTPAEVALIRMTADGRLPMEKRRNYKNVIHALMRITKEEGVTKLWRGTGVTMMRSTIVNAAELGVYAQSRQMLLPKLGDGIFLHFCASMITGLAGAFVSLPVDIVKTRVQNSVTGANPISMFRNIVKTEGVLTLWSGFLPTYLRIGPHTVLTFIFLEQLNALYLRSSLDLS